MARVTNIFALQPAGNVAASKLDVNFAECASYPELEVDSSLNRSIVVGDDGHTIVRTNGSPMGDTLPTPTGTGGNFPVGFEVTIQASTNTVTVTPTASTINGAASLVITAGSSAVINTDGTNWYAQIGTSSSGSIPNVSRQTKTGAYTLISSDKGTMVEATANSWTLDFTTAATLATGFWCYLKNSGAGEITLDPFGGQTIDGLASFILYPNECRLLLCDGSNFFTTIIEAGFQIYTGSGTWTKPPGITHLTVIARGAGGGGGGARGGAAASERNGGAGGGGGALAWATIPAGNLGTTEAVTIGAGGTVGTGGSAANGVAGGVGGTTTFGTTATFVSAPGGGGGAGGDNANGAGGGGSGGTGAAGAAGVTGTAAGAAGGVAGVAFSGSSSDSYNSFVGYTGGDGGDSAAGTTNQGKPRVMTGSGGSGSHNGGGAGSDGIGSEWGGGGGGSGGGVTTGNAESVGGAGGKNTAITNGGGGTAGAVNGGAGGAGTSGAAIRGGAGGGGGGSQDSGTGGAGGSGGIGGGGGGGGGAGTTVGGAGGIGGAGSVWLFWT